MENWLQQSYTINYLQDENGEWPVLKVLEEHGQLDITNFHCHGVSVNNWIISRIQGGVTT